jgi:hypothetical protein
MKKSKLAAITLAAVVALSPIELFAQAAPSGHVMGGISTPWWIFVCPGGIVTAAMAKNWKRHKELSSPEAWTCGLLYWWNEGTGKYGR